MKKKIFNSKIEALIIIFSVLLFLNVKHVFSQNFRANLIYSGESSLENGKKKIEIPKNIKERCFEGTNARKNQKIYVSISMKDESNGVFIKEVNKDFFEVVENKGGNSNAKFVFMVYIIEKESVAGD